MKVAATILQLVPLMIQQEMPHPAPSGVVSYNISLVRKISNKTAVHTQIHTPTTLAEVVISAQGNSVSQVARVEMHTSNFTVCANFLLFLPTYFKHAESLMLHELNEVVTLRWLRAAQFTCKILDMPV